MRTIIDNIKSESGTVQAYNYVKKKKSIKIQRASTKSCPDYKNLLQNNI